MKPTVWVDLTDFEKWSGTLTGIQRVIYNLAVKLQPDPDVKFFKQATETQFIEIPFEDMVYRKPSASTMEKPLSTAGLLRRKSKTAAKLVARPLYHKLPLRYRDMAKSYYMNIRSSRQDQPEQPLSYPFKQGDTVVVLGASWAWNNASLIQSLAAIKEAVGIKVVHLVYDMIPELFPQYFGPGFGEFYSRHIFEVVSLSDRLVSISQSTKRDLEVFIDRWDLPKVPIDVIRLGDDINSQIVTEDIIVDERLQPGNFILTVGTIEVRKNHALLYNVWKNAANQKLPMPRLVIVGRPGWLVNDLMYQLSTDPNIDDSIMILSDLKDEALSWLYQNCRFTIYPSFYEGWGLPIAESLAYGKLCLASETSSMQEMAGPIIEYFNPYDSAACLNLIQKYNDPAALQEREAYITAEYKTTDWNVTYQGLVEALAKV